MLLEITTHRVLIMEWIEGRRLRRAGKNGFGPSQAELQDDLKLVEIGVQCSLEQVCASPLPDTVEKDAYNTKNLYETGAGWLCYCRLVILTRLRKILLCVPSCQR